VNESQLIDQISAALDEEAATIWAPGGAAGVARKRARCRRLTRGLVATAPAVALAAGLVIATTGQQTPATQSARHAQARVGTHAPVAMTVAYVTKRARSALSQAKGYILVSRSRGLVQWSDTATGVTRQELFGPGGTATAAETWTFSGSTQRRTYIDYTTRTWWRLTSKVAVTPRKASQPGIPAPSDTAQGRVTILGHRSLDSHDTILVLYAPPRDFKPSPAVQWPTEQIWYDASSYLPLRTKIIYPGGAVNIDSLTWLRPTPANLAKLSVSPPAAFTRVAPPPFRGDGRPGLGQVP